MAPRVDEVVNVARVLFFNSRIGWVKYVSKYVSKTLYQELKEQNVFRSRITLYYLRYYLFVRLLTRIQYYNCVEDIEICIRVDERNRIICSFEM
jgi:hypothetical protein